MVKTVSLSAFLWFADLLLISFSVKYVLQPGHTNSNLNDTWVADYNINTFNNYS